MNERIPISKTLRFEVFKRDKFTCQYCGAIGGQVLLHCDHVVPVAEGGETTLLNLITACAACNLGKGARPLSDDSALSKQHRQLADLEERRQQLEMMRQWREDLAQHQVDQIDIVADAFLARSKFRPNDHGNISVRRWLRKYGLHELLAAIDETFDLYYTGDTEQQWEEMFKRIPRTLAMRQQEKTDPHIRKLLYIQGILRNRFDDPHGNYVERVRDAVEKGYPIEVLETYAKSADTWSGYIQFLSAWSKRQKAAEPVAEEEVEPEYDDTERWVEESWRAWADPEFHIHMFAQGLSGNARAVLEILATWTRGQRGGFIEGAALNPDDVPILRGMRAVGLIQPIHRHKDIVKHGEDGRIDATFSIPVLSAREATDAFNRHGSLRLSFWGNPAAFARVDEVH